MRHQRRPLFPFILLAAMLIVVTLAGCRSPVASTAEAAVAIQPTLPPAEQAQAVATSGPLSTAVPSVETVEPLAPGPTAELVATPFYDGPLSPACGLLMPAVVPEIPPPITDLSLDESTQAALLARAPAAVRPALQRLLDHPEHVGLAAYQLGQTEQGAFLNESATMPLASVSKLVVLAAYAEAIAAGVLNPLEPVPLSELERYYLPNFDLGAHRRALVDMRQNGRLGEEDDPLVLLEDVAWMMMRHSSNAASDYLHYRLGQERIEQTAVALGLTNHSAPCTFLGQFLLMANHTRGAASDRTALQAYGPDSAAVYGADTTLLADAFTGSEAFRSEETQWRRGMRRPSLDTQQYFTENLNTHGTAGEYAALMARLAQNGLSSADSSFQARRVLEWPNLFPVNQELFSNIAYKNGSLPGVLNTAYYVYRWGDSAPVVVALFFRHLPQQTYRDWRDSLTHDELARWLLADPEAIGLLRAALFEGTSPQ